MIGYWLKADRFRFLRVIIALVLTVSVSVSAVWAADEDAQEEGQYSSVYENINEWEDQVLAEASGILSYEGRLYYAYEDYIDELITYLDQDDVDLGKKDASEAIGKIRDDSNVKLSAQSGFLYQIGGKPRATGAISDGAEYDGELYPEFDSSVRFSDVGEYKASELYKNNKKYINDSESVVYESQKAMREEMKKISSAARDYQDIVDEREDTAAEPAGLGYIAVIYDAAGIIALLVVLILAFMNFRARTMPLLRGLDEERWNLSSSRGLRKRVRKTSSIALTAVCAVCVALVISGITYMGSLGSDNYIESSIDRGGIVQNDYMQFRNEVHSYLGEHNLPQNALDLAMTYREYKFDYVKGTREAIKKGDVEVGYRGIQETLEAQIDLLAYVAGHGSEEIVGDVGEMYTQSMSTDAGVYIHDLREETGNRSTAGFITAALSLILTAALLILIHKDKYRGLLNIGEGITIGSAIWAVIALYIKFGFSVDALGIESDTAYVTMKCAVNQIESSMWILMAVGMVVGVSILVTSLKMREKA